MMRTKRRIRTTCAERTMREMRETRMILTTRAERRMWTTRAERAMPGATDHARRARVILPTRT